ncbi:glycosyl transferase [Luteitalea sp. TBR-22]|uniref:TIGR03013 family XrtA/PEP-CTERM system glycosyltransferase n=1 Tax=Luteitalea sp. TBR-22 TaxID=2802971 RepID=UPI001AFA09AE|nr:TIGR03013 family XrtA/PEP-CTERM system glycosyltransferase [Luteitalea sp. TBR-22]BCS33214.1 glycosyl transferase [Luteitalea sp. TBR-22]
MAALLQRITWRNAVLILFESVLLVAALAVATSVRLGVDALQGPHAVQTLLKIGLVVGVCQVCLYYGELYDLRVVADRRELFVRVLQSLGAASLVLAALYYWFPALVIGRGVFLLAAAAVVSLVAGWRFAFEWVAGRVGPRERLLVVGTGAAALTLAAELRGRRRELGVKIIGFVDAEGIRPLGGEEKVIGSVDDIPAIVREHQVDRVVVSLADARGKLPMDKLLDMKLAGVVFDHLASVYEEYTGKIALENLRPSWLIFSEGFRKSALLTTAKRAADILAAVLGLVIAAPVMAIVAIAVRMTSHGPALYHQERVGQHGRTFTVHKFRSMRSDAEAATGAVWAQRNDSRVTPVGAFLRKTRLDEIPQLWNVLKGEMSLVGPRPERPEFVRMLTEQIPFYGQRHSVKPGVTGWAQVSYTYGASVEDAMEKLQYDLYYIKNLSMSLDLFVLFKTVQTVVLKRGQ